MLSELETRRKKLNTSKIESDNVVESGKNALIKKLFSAMAENGVDVNDIGSIREFLERLDNQNPDLRILFENAFNGLDDSMRQLDDGSPMDVPPPVVPNEEI